MSETYFPTFRKWYRTPWRSLVPFAFSGKPNWQFVLAQTDLPVSVTTTIHDVISKSGLTRREKRDVCVELVSHFEDGGDAGSYEAVLGEFGDPQLAAKLIGRSKKRNRSMFQKATSVFGWISLASIIAYAGLWAAFLSDSPRPSVDYISQLNVVAEAADANDCAWPIYRESWIENKFSHQFESKIYAGDDNDGYRLMEPGEDGWAETAEFLRKHRSMLESFRAAAAKGSCGLKIYGDPSKYGDRDYLAMNPHAFDEQGVRIPWSDEEDNEALRQVNQMLICVLLPQAQLFRSAAHHVSSDVYLAIEENDSSRALANLKSNFGIANHASESAVLVCSLVGLAIVDDGLEQIEDVMANHPGWFSDEELVELKTCLTELSIRDMIKFDGERAMFYDLLQRQYSDDGSGDGRMTMLGLRMQPYVDGLTRSDVARVNSIGDLASSTIGIPTRLFAGTSRKELKNKYDEIMADAERAFDKRISIDIESYFEEGELESRFPILTAFVSRLEQVRTAMEARMQRRDSVVKLIETELSGR